VLCVLFVAVGEFSDFSAFQCSADVAHSMSVYVTYIWHSD